MKRFLSSKNQYWANILQYPDRLHGEKLWTLGGVLCDEIYNFNPKIDITLSQIITRTDSPGINEKVAQLNNLLKGLCEARNLGIISHENIDERGLDRFGLHLNRSGSGIMARNLINCIQHL